MEPSTIRSFKTCVLCYVCVVVHAFYVLVSVNVHMYVGSHGGQHQVASSVTFYLLYPRLSLNLDSTVSAMLAGQWPSEILSLSLPLPHQHPKWRVMWMRQGPPGCRPRIPISNCQSTRKKLNVVVCARDPNVMGEEQKGPLWLVGLAPESRESLSQENNVVHDRGYVTA